VRVVELASLGPVPWCGMVLAGLGADVVRVERPGAAAARQPELEKFELTDRGIRRVEADLKTEQGRAAVLELVAGAEVLMEGMRPGVAERLSLGPQQALQANPALVYGRMTGWGQDGPLAQRAGHDINYIALTGALHAIGSAGGPPVPPLNLLGDYGGGGAFLAIGLLSALLEARRSGVGTVVDVAMIDGVASLMALQWGRLAAGQWQEERGANLLDGGVPWYGVYETADGRYVAVGALEPAFYEQFLHGLGLDPASLPDRANRDRWPELRAHFAAALRERTRDEWQTRFEGTDACVTPVLTMSEAARHPHLVQRRTLVELGGVVQPAPAPRFGRVKPGKTTE
jgi:alpha-methylacyl-CoA racemase